MLSTKSSCLKVRELSPTNRESSPLSSHLQEEIWCAEEMAGAIGAIMPTGLCPSIHKLQVLWQHHIHKIDKYRAALCRQAANSAGQRVALLLLLLRSPVLYTVQIQNLFSYSYISARILSVTEIYETHMCQVQGCDNRVVDQWNSLLSWV